MPTLWLRDAPDMSMYITQNPGSWTLSERTLWLSIASMVVAFTMALLTNGAVWYAAVAAFALTTVWAVARIKAGELRP